MVLAYCGHAGQLAAIARAAADGHAVVAVACDLDGATSLNELREQALAAGAARCHALDLRDAYLRDHVVPALRAGGYLDPAAFVDARVAEIAALEGAAPVPCVMAETAPASPASRAYAYDYPAYAALTFADGVPVALNGIPMTISEVVDSLETITHRPAIDLLRRAYAELAGGAPDRVTFQVSADGCCVARAAAVQ